MVPIILMYLKILYTVVAKTIRTDCFLAFYLYFHLPFIKLKIICVSKHMHSNVLRPMVQLDLLVSNFQFEKLEIWEWRCKSIEKQTNPISWWNDKFNLRFPTLASQQSMFLSKTIAIEVMRLQINQKMQS
jgi:hypothetical protein